MYKLQYWLQLYIIFEASPNDRILIVTGGNIISVIVKREKLKVSSESKISKINGIKQPCVWLPRFLYCTLQHHETQCLQFCLFKHRSVSLNTREPGGVRVLVLSRSRYLILGPSLCFQPISPTCRLCMLYAICFALNYTLTFLFPVSQFF